MVGEYTLAIGAPLPTKDAQGWAEWIQHKARSNGAMGTAMWLWKNDPHHDWSMKHTSNLVTEGGINWRQAFGLEGK